MDRRLLQLMRSFASATNDYALVRLEFALRHPKLAAPPLIDEPSNLPEETLPEKWDKVERQVDALQRYIRNVNDHRGKRAVYDLSFAHLQRTYRMLDQYTRAVRWIITVEDRRTSS